MQYNRILSVLALSVFLAGCTGWFAKLPGASQVAQLTQPRASESDFDFIEDATLRKHMAAQANQTSFRLRTSSSGLGTTMVQEMQFSDTTFNMRSWQEDGAKKSAEMTMVGDVTYLLDYSDNVWWKQQAEEVEAEENQQEESLAEPVDFKEVYTEMKDTAVYKNLGQEPCGALTCYKYEQTDTENSESKRTFWFDTKDFLMRKDQSMFGEFSSSSEYEYDGISISAPSPTKDVPEGKNIYEYMVYGDMQIPQMESDEFKGMMEKMNTQDFTVPQNLDSLMDESMFNDSFGGDGAEE